VTYWLELNTGWRRNGANTLARHAGSEPTNGRKTLPGLGQGRRISRQSTSEGNTLWEDLSVIRWKEHFYADINMAFMENPVSFAHLLYRRYAKPGSTAGEKDAATTGTVWLALRASTDSTNFTPSA